MTDTGIVPITMPKWGLSMIEGKVNEWLVEENTDISVGDPILDIETEKIANTFEALDAGLLRRRVASPEETLPIGALLGVLAPSEIDDAEIDAYVTEFQANFVPPEPEEEDAGPAYEFVEVGGYRLRYLKMGDADKQVLLIHGFGGDLDRWLFTQQPLSAGATVTALDLPGHGQSTKTIDGGSVASLAAVVVQFMDAVGISSAHLIGHSLGGAIALKVALDAPTKVSALSLIAAAGLGDEINATYINGFIEAESRREVKPLLQQLVGDPKLINRSLIDDVLKFKRLDGVTEALTEIANGFIADSNQSDNMREQIGSLTIPIQTIWGTADQIIPVAHSEGLPDSVQTHVFEGYGHLVQLEAASEVNQLLDGF